MYNLPEFFHLRENKRKFLKAFEQFTLYSIDFETFSRLSK